MMPVSIVDVDTTTSAPRPTGVPELDRVLGGGLVPGSVTVLGGEPGIGKSTLVLQALAGLAPTGLTCLLATGEESVAQVRSRAERVEALHTDIGLVAESSLAAVESYVEALRPDVLVIDSIQTLRHPDHDVAPGSVVQVRDCANDLVALSKARSLTTVLVGHVTKEGSLAGPRTLEHVVDTVLSVEGDRNEPLRVVRPLKHRFGSTDELGVFSMGPDGLEAVADASGLLLADRRAEVPGSVVSAGLEGGRPLLVEVQALVASTTAPVARRSAQSFDGGRLAMLLAVLERRAGITTGDRDVYASVAGGIRVAGPALDLAVALAIASSDLGLAIRGDLLAVGELGLGGEVRRVPGLERRLGEAARVGFRAAVVPDSCPDIPGIQLHRATDLAAALRFAELPVAC